MCGIAGIVLRSPDARTPDRDVLSRMAASLAHRGPDEFGVYRHRKAGLAHARLAIVDLSTGQQPLCNEDGTLWIVFNGEVFNYVELRRELEALGHRFRTQSDTEVVVHAYEQWSDAAFARFNGQFALALWDETSESLTLARDLAGICPLYVAEYGGRVLFGSEVKALFAADPELPRALDAEGLAQVFTFWTVVPPMTVFRGIEQLRPGWVRRYRRDGMDERPFAEFRYPRSPDEAFSGTLNDAVEAVRAELLRATELRMLRADVPVGSYLSGGLDSSLVAALGLAAKGSGFATFSLRFADAEYDETSFQRQMARAIGSDHHEIMVTRRDIAQAFPSVIAHGERPILRAAPAPLFLLSSLVREAGFKVVLTGEGADEMFAGYDIFREAKVRRFWARQPDSKFRPRLLDRLYPYLARSPMSQRAMARQFFGRNLGAAAEPGFSHDMRWESARSLWRLFGAETRAMLVESDPRSDMLSTLPRDFPRWTRLAQDQFLEIRTLLWGYLLSAQGDRMLMAHSVEGRFPFLDPFVIALANSLPPAMKLRVLDEKHVLKRVARGLVPDAIIQRTKQPYRAPDALSFAMRDRPAYVDELLNPHAIAEAGIFDSTAVGRLWEKCCSRRDQAQFSNADNMAVVGVLSTQLLISQVIRRPLPAPAPRITTLVEKLAAVS